MIYDCNNIMGKAPGCKYFSNREAGFNEWNADLVQTKSRHRTWMLDSDNGKAGDVSPACQDWYNRQHAVPLPRSCLAWTVAEGHFDSSQLDQSLELEPLRDSVSSTLTMILELTAKCGLHMFNPDARVYYFVSEILCKDDHWCRAVPNIDLSLYTTLNSTDHEQHTLFAEDTTVCFHYLRIFDVPPIDPAAWYKLVARLDPSDPDVWPSEAELGVRCSKPVNGTFNLHGASLQIQTEQLKRAFFDVYQEAQALFRRLSDGLFCSMLEHKDADQRIMSRQYQGPASA